jgi:hypothetical protein
MRYYLAYGSNLNRTQMRHRCPDAYPVGKTVLPNYQLVFRRGVLTIEPEHGSSVPVVVWAISREDERRLDRYEGFPRLYYKHEFPLVFTGESRGKATEIIVDGMAYIMTDGYPIQEPSILYMMTCMKGYDDFGLDMTPLFEAKDRAEKGGDA